MTDVVTYEGLGRIGVITVANPPVNALSRGVRAGLMAAVEAFEADGAGIAVLVGQGRLFLGGADISEFGRPIEGPGLPDVVLRLERAAKPLVAAIHGAALGGGLEVALGCHYRLAIEGARLGFPEVGLGILPGAGGTQRAPRLVGMRAAAEMISSGKPVAAARAAEIGLVDRVAAGDPRVAGIAFAEALLEEGAGPRPVGAMPAPGGADLSDLRADLAARARGQVAPARALDALEAAASLSFEDGLAEERRIFSELMETPQRAGLVHAFFAERAVSKVPDIDGVAPREVSRLGVIGGGTMGAGIATAALLSGLEVILVERDTDAARKAEATVSRNLDAADRRGKVADRAAVDAAYRSATDLSALEDVDIAIEAVFESMDVKREVFAALDAVLRPGAVLATNTSYLDVNRIAAATSRPADVIGLHFFSPAHVMKLLEIVVPDSAAPDVVATGFALGKRLGKIGVRAGVCDGFIGNRILAHYRMAADHMVLDGASPYAIDRALEAFGFAMGPYRVSDLAGLDIGFMTRERKAAFADPRDRRPAFADALYHAGRLGQKTGAGYYDYSADRRGREDPAALEIVAASREDAREFPDEEIVRRYMAAMVNEAARVVDEGIARRPLDVDVVKLHGYGFPRWRGGPMHWADAAGLGTILDDVRRLADEDDHFWRPAPLLERLVGEGRGFAALNGGAA